jgi:hypothetical protein
VVGANLSIPISHDTSVGYSPMLQYSNRMIETESSKTGFGTEKIVAYFSTTMSFFS